MLILLVLVLILLIILIIIISCFFVVPLLRYGAPFEGTKKNKLKDILSIGKLSKTDRIVDLGSGDGRIVIAFAKRGVEAHGYEINPFLVWISRRKIKRLGLENKAFIHFRNFWKQDLSKFNIVVMFQYSLFMKGIEKKLRKETKKGARIISNHWKFPSLKLIKKKDDIYLYRV